MRQSIPMTLTGLALFVLSQSAFGQQVPQAQQLPSSASVVNPGWQIRPGLSLQQAAFNTAVVGQAISQIPPYALGYNPYPQTANYGPVRQNVNTWPGMTSFPTNSSLSSLPYGSGSGSYLGSSGYNNPYYPMYYYDGNSFGPSLQGLSSLTYAQGQYLNDWQRARMTNQQVEQTKIETRKQMLQLWQQERMNTPTLEELRAKQQDLEVRRARRDPPLTEILSGKSLNDLYKNSANLQAKGVVGTDVKLDPELLQKITLTSARGGNIGLLKNEGKLNWTVTLKESMFDKDRDAIDQLAADAVKKAEFNNSVDPATLNQMRKHLENLTKTLESNGSTISTGKYLDASRYLNKLEDAIRALEDPNVSNFFTQKWAAKGKTVSELVEHLRKNGLQFASAAPGEEAAYQALHHAMATYDTSMSQNSVSTKP
jgi:hypothetical protein